MRPETNDSNLLPSTSLITDTHQHLAEQPVEHPLISCPRLAIFRREHYGMTNFLQGIDRDSALCGIL